MATWVRLRGLCVRSVQCSVWRPRSRAYAHHSSFSFRTHRCGELRISHVGENVTLCGWVRRTRLLGAQGVAFIPLSDASGVTQLICDSQEWRDVVQSLKVESVVKARGVVRPRPQENVNQEMPTGAVEVVIDSLEVLNEATHLPFSLSGKGPGASEELRLRERQLDLRQLPLQHNLRLRSQVAMATREYLINQHGFVEIETPTLFRRTSEGAREFVVPTRNPGKFYSLAQSPQQFKQLLMVGGFDRYFQFARCYRDEDLRADRQPEFTQVDLEMSFTDAECIMSLVEELLVTALGQTVPHMKLPTSPFPRLPYREAMEKYGSDKPDTRYGMEIQDLNHIWRQSFEGEKPAQLRAFKVPNWEEVYRFLSRKEKAALKEQLNEHCYGVCVALVAHRESKLASKSGSTSICADVLRGYHKHSKQVFEQALDYLHCEHGDVCVLGACQEESGQEHILTALGSLRTLFASVLEKSNILKLDSEQLNFLWVTGFPLFTITEDPAQGTLTVQSTHHPFTAPISEDEHCLYQYEDPTALAMVRAQHYDLVVNGVELGGGSIRIHSADLQEHVLKKILKVPTEQFSHLLKGLRSGCPPHGGIALGLDRLMAVLCQASSLRDVIAFPKSFQGKDLLTGAPSDVERNELSDYHISILTKNKSLE